MSAEKWLPVVGWEGLYEVSDLGRVRSSEGRRQKSIVRKPTQYNNGYLYVCLSAPGRRVRTSVHRAVLSAFVGPCPDGWQGCHNNGDRTDNRLENLRWDTPANNSADKHGHGTIYRPSEYRTHCKRGHEYTEESTYAIVSEGYRARVCRTCRNESDRAKRAAATAKRLAAAGGVLAVVGLLALPMSAAATGQSKSAVCHPTGKGYVLINPSRASSHIDETKYPNGVYWKHEHGGRHDVYAVAGACPSTPSPTTTGGTPSTPTTVPTTATSTTSRPTTSAPSTTVPSPTTSQPTSPSPTSSTPGSRTPSTGPTYAHSGPAPATRSTARSSAFGRPSSSPPPSTISPLTSVPSSAVAPPEELAHTGLNGLGRVVVIGLTLLVLGLGAFAYAYAIHKGSRRGGHR